MIKFLFKNEKKTIRLEIGANNSSDRSFATSVLNFEFIFKAVTFLSGVIKIIEFASKFF